MNDYFITNIKIKKVRHLENIKITLGEEKKHLILTGKNGCGKTSVLNELNKYFSTLFNSPNEIKIFYEYKDKLNNLNLTRHQHKSIFNKVAKFENCYPVFNLNEAYKLFMESKKDFLYAYFPALRRNETKQVNGINKLTLSGKKTTKLNINFLQYIVNLKAEKSFARDDADTETVIKIDNWFNKFEHMLKKIFSDESLHLVFDRKEYNFTIHRSNREPFDFNSLSSGYSAIIDIISELILKIETTDSKNFDCQGIVLIDELETHLHVDLQKNILSFLTIFFPNIQFIVTTHSPFILSSLPNSVIYDLEKNFRTEDLTAYSYDALIESYFDSDKYSQEVKSKLERFEELSKLEILSDIEKDEYYEFKIYFKSLPTFMADELAVKINEILLNDFNKRK